MFYVYLLYADAKVVGIKITGEVKLKDSMENKESPSGDGIVGQIANWINEEADEADSKLKNANSSPRDIGKRERTKSTPSLIKRNSPTALPALPLPITESQENEDKKKQKVNAEEKAV